MWGTAQERRAKRRDDRVDCFCYEATSSGPFEARDEGIHRACVALDARRFEADLPPPPEGRPEESRIDVVANPCRPQARTKEQLASRVKDAPQFGLVRSSSFRRQVMEGSPVKGCFKGPLSERQLSRVGHAEGRREPMPVGGPPHRRFGEVDADGAEAAGRQEGDFGAQAASDIEHRSR
jgi:hypothetical protein